MSTNVSVPETSEASTAPLRWYAVVGRQYNDDEVSTRIIQATSVEEAKKQYANIVHDCPDWGTPAYKERLDKNEWERIFFDETFVSDTEIRLA